MPGTLITSRRGFLAVGAATVGRLPLRRARRPYPFTLRVASGEPTTGGVVLWTGLAEPVAPDGGIRPEVVTVECELALDEFRDDQPCDDGAAWGDLKVDDSCAERPHARPALFGTRQRDRLPNGLRRSGTRWDLLAQQLDPNPGWWEVDSWDRYTADRAQVLQVVQDLDRGDTVVPSGDLLHHHHLVADLHLGPDAPVPASELVAGAVSSSTFAIEHGKPGADAS